MDQKSEIGLWCAISSCICSKFDRCRTYLHWKMITNRNATQLILMMVARACTIERIMPLFLLDVNRYIITSMDSFARVVDRSNRMISAMLCADHHQLVPTAPREEKPYLACNEGTNSLGFTSHVCLFH